MIVYRGVGTEVVIDLASDEELGVLDTGYLEDYYGTDGQVSLHHLATGDRFALLMVGVPELTPLVANDRFRGVMDMSGLPDGDYRVEGLVRDTLGNYSVLGAHHDPPSGARLLLHEFELRSGVPFPPSTANLVPIQAPAFLVSEPTLVYLEVRDQAMMMSEPTPVYLQTIEPMFVTPEAN